MSAELMNPIWKKIPHNIVLYILQYDRNYAIKNGKIIIINRIPLADYRYRLLTNSFINNPLIIKFKTHIVNNVYYVNVKVKLIINENKEYEFTLRHFYFDETTHIRRNLFLRNNGINIEMYMNY
jgi:hypothetical protein